MTAQGPGTFPSSVLSGLFQEQARGHQDLPASSCPWPSPWWWECEGDGSWPGLWEQSRHSSEGRRQRGRLLQRQLPGQSSETRGQNSPFTCHLLPLRVSATQEPQEQAAGAAGAGPAARVGEGIRLSVSFTPGLRASLGRPACHPVLFLPLPCCATSGQPLPS